MPKGAVPFPFGHCRVCNAQATGNHYGANTCEGCKGFFKRSLGKWEKYKCLNNEKCAIDPENRIKCKLCRFKRCLELGMSMDAIKMGRIPKVQKQKALEDEKAVQGSTSPEGNTSIPDSCRDAYRNCNTQSSPPSQELIEPPSRKQMKPSASESEVGGGQRSLALQHHSTQQTNGHIQQMVCDSYQERMRDGIHGTQSKLNYGANLVHDQESQDMVQMLNDVIAIDDSRDVTQQPISNRMASSDYARTLALAATCNPTDMYSHLVPQHRNQTKDHSQERYAAVPISSRGHDFPGHHRVYSKYPTSHVHPYDEHALDVYMQPENSHNKIAPAGHVGTRDGSHTTTSRTTHSSASLPAMTSALPRRIPDSHVKGHENGSYNCVSSSNSSYCAREPPSYGSVPREGLSSHSSYECDVQHSSCSPPNQGQQELHSDYGSVDELSPGSNPGAVGPCAPSADEDYDSIIKAVSSTYWDVTADVRDGVEVMEDIIATGSTDRMLPFCRENYDTLWKWLMEAVAFYNQMMTKFFIKCPLLSGICPEDTSVLIQHSYISVWLIWYAPVFKNGQTYIPFRNSFVYTRSWMERIIPPDFVTYLHEYTTRQNSARFSVNEIALLCGLALTPSNVADIKYPEVVKQIHEEFNKMIKREIYKNRVNSKEMLNEIPQLLKHLETAVAKREIILSFNEQTPPEIPFS